MGEAGNAGARGFLTDGEWLTSGVEADWRPLDSVLLLYSMALWKINKQKCPIQRVARL